MSHSFHTSRLKNPIKISNLGNTKLSQDRLLKPFSEPNQNYIKNHPREVLAAVLCNSGIMGYAAPSSQISQNDSGSS